MSEKLMTQAEKNAEQKLVDKAFDQLSAILSHTHEFDRYTEKQEQDERDHRRGRTGPYGITVAKSARMFAVRHILDYRRGDVVSDAADIFSIRLTCFMGYALYRKEQAKIDAAFTAEQARSLCAID